MVEIINAESQSLREQYEDGETKTNLLEKQMTGLRRVLSEKTSGKLGTKGYAMEGGEMEIGKGADPRNSRSVAKSGSEHFARNLWTISEQSKSSGSSQVWQAPNYSEK